MTRILLGLLKGLGGLIGAILALTVLLMLTIWVADPTVLKNLFFGQPLGQPAAVEKSQPQEIVVGRPQENIRLAARNGPTRRGSPRRSNTPTRPTRSLC